MKEVVLKIPQMGEGIQEVKITELLKNSGDYIQMDEHIYSMETDKSIVEVESSVEGRLVEWKGQVGEVMPVGVSIAIIESKIMDTTENKLHMSSDDDVKKNYSLNNQSYFSTSQRDLIRHFRKSHQVCIPCTVVFKIKSAFLQNKKKQILQNQTNLDRVSYFKIIAFAISKILPQNTRFMTTVIDDNSYLVNTSINLGIAVLTELKELSTAVVEDANQLDFHAFLSNINNSIDQIRKGKHKNIVQPNIVLSYTKNSNIEWGSPVLVYPAVATIALNLTDLEKEYFYCSMTFDHRIVNGNDVEKFILDLNKYLEQSL